MKKKIVTLVPLALLIVASLGSCRGNGDDTSKQSEVTTETSDQTNSESSSTHTHTHDAKWSSDDTSHWHNATCGDIARVDEGNHEYGEWEVVEEATENFYGLKKHTCTVCGHEETQEIEKVEHVHSMKYVKKVYATCESEGVKAHYQCTTCGKLFKDEDGEEETTLKALTIKVSDHTYSSTWSYDDTNHWHNATCGHDEKGDFEEHDIVNGTCSICGYVAVTPGIQYTISSDGKSYIVTGVESDFALSGKVIIGSTYNGLPVTAIADNAFKNDTNITSLLIPGSITTIGKNAFSSCQNLKEVVILEGVLLIGDGAFSSCENLETITLPNSVTTFGNYIFANSNNLKYNEYDNAYYLGNSDNPYLFLVQKMSAQISTCTINDKCKAISNYAFADSALTSITIPGSITSIGDYAFSGCSSLQTVTMLEGVLNIGDCAFVNCSNLKKVQFPNSIQSLGYQIFEYSYVYHYYTDACKEYNQCYYLGNSNNPYLVLVKASSNIESCIINENCKLIMPEAFNNCANLTNVTIVDSVEFIGKYAFSYCPKLVSVVIPTSVTTIGDSIFKNTDNEGNVYYAGTIDDWKKVDNNSDFANKTINYYSATQPTDTTYKYWHYNSQSEIEVWHVHKIVEVSKIDATCEAKGYKSHYKCEDEYCNKLFSDVEGKTEVTLSDLEIPATGHKLVNYPAVAATSTVDGNIQYWECSVCGKYFNDSTGTTEIADKSSVIIKYESVGLSFEKYWSNSENTYILKGIGTCEDANIVIPSTYNGLPVTRISSSSFKDNKKITSVTIPDSIIYINSDAFSGCTNLKKVIISGSNDEKLLMAADVFANCTNLKEIVMRKNVGIDYGNPFNNTTLDKVYYMGTETDWNNEGIKDKVERAEVYYYCETEPTVNKGDYWHYVGDVPTVYTE